jgi:hypothetical protein
MQVRPVRSTAQDPNFALNAVPLELYSNPRALKCSPDPLVSLQERGSRMVQLLSVLNAAILALCGVLGSAILLAFNSYLRSQAEGHPGSWLYWHVKWCDYLLTHTVLRPAFASTRRLATNTPPNDDTPIGSLHNFAEVEDLVFVRRSYSASVDLSQRMPTSFLNVIGHPGFPPIAAAIATILMMFLVAYLLTRTTSASSVLMGMLVVELIGLATVMALMFWPGSFFRVMQRLHYSPLIVIHIDEKLITSDSAWGRRVFRTSPELAFIAVESEFFLGIGIKDAADREPLGVFSYPRLVEDPLMTSGQLQALCRRLNKLLADVHELPALST